jgi:hypothetical protein
MKYGAMGVDFRCLLVSVPKDFQPLNPAADDGYQISREGGSFKPFGLTYQTSSACCMLRMTTGRMAIQFAIYSTGSQDSS